MTTYTTTRTFSEQKDKRKHVSIQRFWCSHLFQLHYQEEGLVQVYVAAEGGHSIAYCICNCGHYYCSMCYRNYHYPLTCKQVRTSPSLWMFYSMKRGLLTRMKRWTLCSTYTRISSPVQSARFHCSKTLYYQRYVHLANRVAIT